MTKEQEARKRLDRMIFHARDVFIRAPLESAKAKRAKIRLKALRDVNDMLVRLEILEPEGASND